MLIFNTYILPICRLVTFMVFQSEPSNKTDVNNLELWHIFIYLRDTCCRESVYVTQYIIAAGTHGLSNNCWQFRRNSPELLSMYFFEKGKKDQP